MDDRESSIEESSQNNNPNRKESREAPVKAPSRILIIDDDVELTETFSDALEYAGHEVKVVNSGNEGFRIVTRLVPDVVILDMNLPGVSGILLLSHIRHMPRLAHTKVIIVSGYSDLAHTAKAVWGADMYLPKPVSPKQLLEAIDGVGTSKR
jgi:CheY-like chemotaxis protein